MCSRKDFCVPLCLLDLKTGQQDLLILESYGSSAELRKLDINVN